MSNIEIKSIESTDDGKIILTWHHDFDQLTSLGVTFDDDGSWTTTFVDPHETQVSLDTIGLGNYVVFMTANFNGVETRSEPKLFKV